MVRLLAALLEPYMPSLTAKILQQLNLPPSAAQLTDELVSLSATPHLLVAPGHQIGKPEPLITIIKDEVIAELKDRFSGNQADRSAAAAAAAAGSSSSSGTAAAAPGGGKGGGGKAGGSKAEGGGKAKAASGKEKGAQQPAAAAAAASKAGKGSKEPAAAGGKEAATA
jgi:methionyl-tRNA synthetase